MNVEAIQSKKDTLVAQHGPWVSHNIKLADGVYTMKPNTVGKGNRAQRYLQTVADVARKPLKDLRVLDLACGEGIYAIEFALQGAEAVGVEGREQNLVKGEFVKEVLGLDKLTFHQDDVRNFTKEKYGEFDVIFCCGILYHLRENDAITLVQNIYEACTGFLVMDTQFSVAPKVTITHNGKSYAGRFYTEHNPGKSQEAIKEDVYASLDNIQSFWFTVPSLFNLMADVGFSSAFQITNPKARDFDDRIAILAMARERQTIKTLPEVNQDIPERWEERPKKNLHRSQRWYGPLIPYLQTIRNTLRRMRSR